MHRIKITVEAPVGCGKFTIIEALRAWFKGKGAKIINEPPPGSTIAMPLIDFSKLEFEFVAVNTHESQK